MRTNNAKNASEVLAPRPRNEDDRLNPPHTVIEITNATKKDDGEEFEVVLKRISESRSDDATISNDAITIHATEWERMRLMNDNGTTVSAPGRISMQLLPGSVENDLLQRFGITVNAAREQRLKAVKDIKQLSREEVTE